MSDDKDIPRLPVRNKQEDSGKLFLAPPPPKKCCHFKSSFEVDVEANKCSCRECGGDVSPMFVLEQLMKKESLWRRSLSNYQDQMKRLKERSRTKCQHCKKMTQISRN